MKAELVAFIEKQDKTDALIAYENLCEFIDSLSGHSDFEIGQCYRDEAGKEYEVVSHDSVAEFGYPMAAVLLPSRAAFYFTLDGIWDSQAPSSRRLINE